MLKTIQPVRAVTMTALVSGLLTVAACGGPQVTAPPAESLMSETVAGTQTCAEPGGDDAQLFLVQWDATDLSSFEAKAERDVVFVRYEGCEMKVLHGCSDSGIAGRYGTYGKPRWTSGNVESIDIKTQDELFAQLPLGAASFGGELSQGKALKLTYHVTGNVTSTRDEVYQKDLASNARCASATHFVWSYNLGAFELGASETTAVGAEASVAGYGGGGSSERERKVVKHGGEIANCSSQDQRSCRVPIRITLRALNSGEPPTAAQQMEAVTPNQAASISEASLNEAQGMMNGAMLRNSAEQKLMARDGAGCLNDLDRADQIDRQGGKTPQLAFLRGRCLMAAGQCGEGKKVVRGALAAMDTDRRKPDATLDFETQQMADDFCASAKTGGMAPGQAVMTALPQIQMALAQNNADACYKLGTDLANAAAAMDPQTRKNSAYATIPMLAMKAAGCVATAGRCEDAKKLFSIAWKVENPGKANDAKALNDDFSFWVAPCAGK